MLRCKQPGWELTCAPDGRRGLWFRDTGNGIELCAGREGDDEYLQLTLGDIVTVEVLGTLRDCLARLRDSRLMEEGS